MYAAPDFVFVKSSRFVQSAKSTVLVLLEGSKEYPVTSLPQSSYKSTSTYSISLFDVMVPPQVKANPGFYKR